MMPAIAVLCGGLATRMRPITEKIPKSLIPVAGEPFIARQLRLLRNNGFARVVLCAGVMGGMIRDAVGDGSAFDLAVDYSFDGDRPLGTGGALKKAAPLLGDVFMVLYGDSYLDCDYRAAWDFFAASRKQGLMTVYRNGGRFDRSNVVFRDGEIFAYDKRTPTPEMDFIDYGLGALAADAVASLPDDKASDLADLYGELLSRGQLAGYEIDRRFYEIGSPEGLREMEGYFADAGRL